MARLSDDIAACLAERVEYDTNGGCWLWAGAHGRGYGRIKDRNGRIHFVHRLSYALHKGDPAGRFVCHKCDVPSCFNPDHLFLGDHRDNAVDFSRKGFSWRKLTADDVRDIRARVRAGETLEGVARSYGVSNVLIHKIHHRRAWAWLPEAA